MRQDCHHIASRYRDELDQRVAVQAGNRETDARKGCEEWVHPTDEQTDDHQGPETVPARFQVSIAVDVEHVFDGRKPHSSNGGIDNPVQDRIEFISKQEKNDQDGETLESFLDNGSDNGCGPKFSYTF